jgi:hypothetical protein
VNFSLQERLKFERSMPVDYRSSARGAAGGKQLRLLLPIHLAYDVHVGSHGKETEAP